MINSFKDLILNVKENYSNRTAIYVYDNKNGHKKINYSEAVEHISYVSSILEKNNEQYIALFSENNIFWSFCYFGAVLSGKTVIPIDEQMDVDNFLNILKFTKCKTIIISNKVSAYNEVIKKFNGKIYNIEEIASGKAEFPKNVKSLKDNIASIIFTSGTTGEPKGVQLTESNFISNVNAISDLDVANKGSVALAILPFHHCYAFTATLLFAYYKGFSTVYLDSLASTNIIKAINEFKITHIIGVPGLYSLMLSSIEEKIPGSDLTKKILWKLNYFFSRLTAKNIVWPSRIIFSKVHKAFGNNLQVLISGGAKLSEDISTKFLGFGFKVIEGYGLTETAPILSLTPINKMKPGSCGQPLNNIQLKIINKKNGQGEIIAKGPNIMKGYFNKPNETAEVLKDSWFYTGDLGFIDKNNFLYITGRKKELIVLSNGKNIYPEEVEKIYMNSPYIKEICVYAEKNNFSVTKLKAIVVADIDVFKKNIITDIVGKIKYEIENIAVNIPSYMRLSGIKITAEPLARTRLGKLRRSLISSIDYELFEQANKEENSDNEIFQTDIGKIVFKIVKEELKEEKISSFSSLDIDLGLDSLSKLNFFISVEKACGKKLKEDDLGEIITLKDLIEKLECSKEVYSDIAKGIENIFEEEPEVPLKEVVSLKRNFIINFITDIFYYLFKILFKILFSVKIKGYENIENINGPLLICPNHISYLDAFLIYCILPKKVIHELYFLGDDEIFKKGIAFFLRRIFRVVPTGEGRVLRTSLQYATKLLKNNKYVVIFPEGGRSIDGILKYPKQGTGILSKYNNVSILPIYIEGLFGFLSRNKEKLKFRKIKIEFLDIIRSGNEPKKIMDKWYKAMMKRENNEK